MKERTVLAMNALCGGKPANHSGLMRTIQEHTGQVGLHPCGPPPAPHARRSPRTKSFFVLCMGLFFDFFSAAPVVRPDGRSAAVDAPVAAGEAGQPLVVDGAGGVRGGAPAH